MWTGIERLIHRFVRWLCRPLLEELAALRAQLDYAPPGPREHGCGHVSASFAIHPDGQRECLACYQTRLEQIRRGG